jgi:hypothetical protein
MPLSRKARFPGAYMRPAQPAGRLEIGRAGAQPFGYGLGAHFCACLDERRHGVLSSGQS